MIRDCRRCGGPLEVDLAGSPDGPGTCEVRRCRVCRYDEPVLVVPLTRHEVLERIAIVKARQRGLVAS